MLTSTNQGTLLALLHMIFGKRFSPGRLVSRGEGRLQAHHDVLHHSRAGASRQESGCEKGTPTLAHLKMYPRNPVVAWSLQMNPKASLSKLGSQFDKTGHVK